jgi:hypothetical protein
MFQGIDVGRKTFIIACIAINLIFLELVLYEIKKQA